MSTTKSAADLVVGDEWREDRQVVRMLGCKPCPIRSIVRVEVEAVPSDGRRFTVDLYRENRRQLVG